MLNGVHSPVLLGLLTEQEECRSVRLFRLCGRCLVKVYSCWSVANRGEFGMRFVEIQFEMTMHSNDSKDMDTSSQLIRMMNKGY